MPGAVAAFSGKSRPLDKAVVCNVAGVRLAQAAHAFVVR